MQLADAQVGQRTEQMKQAMSMWRNTGPCVVCQKLQGKIHEVEAVEDHASKPHKPTRGGLRLQCAHKTTQGAYDALEAARRQQ